MMTQMKADINEFDRLITDRVQLIHDKKVFELTDRKASIDERLGKMHQRLMELAKTIQTVGRVLKQEEIEHHGI